MADQLATASDLASYLQSDVDTATATLLIECATAVVQEAAGGQRIVQVVGDTMTILGTSDSWLDLPQRPVAAVTSVTLDGVALAAGTDYKVFGDRIWRRQGWQANTNWPYGFDGATWYAYQPSSLLWPMQEPSTVVVVNTHGYPPGDQRLQFGRSVALGLARSVYANPAGINSESIDDYSVTYERMTSQMESSPHLKAALAKKYGRRAGLVRVG